jgi:hypothetical protein
MNIVASSVRRRMKSSSSADVLYLPMEYHKQYHLKRALAIYRNDWSLISESDDDREKLFDLLSNDKSLFDFSRIAESYILDNPYYNLPEGEDLYYNDILALVREYAEYRDVIIIDPITAIDADPRSKASQWDQQKKFVRQCSKIAEECEVHIMMMSHSGKRGQYQGKTEELRVGSLAGSAALERFTQYILSLDFHKPVESRCYVGGGMHQLVEHTRTLRVEKLNFGPGTRARVAMDFDGGPRIRVLGVIEEEIC